MSKDLQEEQEKYSEFLESMQKLTEGREEELQSSALEESKELMNQYTQDLSISGFKKFWKEWEADTPEEVETLELCKAATLGRVKLFSAVGVLLSSTITTFYLEHIPARAKFMCSLTGLFLGGIFGVIQSNKENMKRFDSLGSEYFLGRLAKDEALQWDTELTKS
mmetsp:Transcript_3951/g.5978  ORF Transcript_3951/g.5978 Transcript_3951/m.5978 type:complete len:165 (+) Transcript_3951:2166-2660(+)